MPIIHSLPYQGTLKLPTSGQDPIYIVERKVLDRKEYADLFDYARKKLSSLAIFPYLLQVLFFVFYRYTSESDPDQ